MHVRVGVEQRLPALMSIHVSRVPYMGRTCLCVEQKYRHMSDGLLAKKNALGASAGLTLHP